MARRKHIDTSPRFFLPLSCSGNYFPALFEHALNWRLNLMIWHSAARQLKIKKSLGSDKSSNYRSIHALKTLECQT